MVTDERALVAALAAALAPTPVFWGWAPLESADLPASLPLVTLQRLTYSTASYEDMCEDVPVRGDTTLLVHAWALGYEQARTLAAQARDAVLAAEGWGLQTETDQYEPGFRAWRVEAQWFAEGVPPL
jgi:hypothetical protein